MAIFVNFEVKLTNFVNFEVKLTNFVNFEVKLTIFVNFEVKLTNFVNFEVKLTNFVNFEVKLASINTRKPILCGNFEFTELGPCQPELTKKIGNLCQIQSLTEHPIQMARKDRHDF